MSVTDQLLENNEKYAAGFSGPLPLPPSKNIAVLACMDARLDVYALLGLEEGESHVIRNAGGVVTDDEIRSLAISQRLLGTKEIVLIHHTDCGMLTFTDDEFKASIQEETGLKPAWAAESFTDLDTDVRQSIARIKASPFVPHTDQVRGFVFDVATGGCARSPSDRGSVRADGADGRADGGPAAGLRLDLGVEAAGGAGVAGRPGPLAVLRAGGVHGEAHVVTTTAGTHLLDDDHGPVRRALPRLGAAHLARRSVPWALMVTVTLAGARAEAAGQPRARTSPSRRAAGPARAPGSRSR